MGKLSEKAKAAKANRDKKYYLANKAKITEYKRKWSLKNRTKLAVYHQKYYLDNKVDFLKKCEEYRKKNKKAINRRNLEYYWNNQEALLMRSKCWRKMNQKKKKRMDLEYRAANKERIEVRRKAYVLKNKDKIKRNFKIWHSSEAGRASHKHNKHKRRAFENGCESKATPLQILQFLRSAISCQYCKTEFDSIVKPELDHIVPLSKGGAHSLDNFAAACRKCNNRKSAKHLEKFLAELKNEN